MKTRRGAPRGQGVFWIAAFVLVLATAWFGWMWMSGVPEGVEASPACGVLFLVPFTTIWIAGLLANRNASVSYYREGIRQSRVAIAWDDVVGVARLPQDPEITTPPGWRIWTADGREVRLPGWLVEDGDLAPLVERNIRLPEDSGPTK